MNEKVSVKIKKIHAYYLENGLFKSLAHCCFCLWDRAFDLMARMGLKFDRKDLIFFERKLDVHETLPLFHNSEIECFPIGQKTVEATEEYFDGWFDKGEALRRLKEGRLLFAIRRKGKSVGNFWVEVQKVVIPSLDLSFTIPRNTACIAYIFVAPEYRGLGIASKAMPLLLQGLKSRGYRHLFLLIAPRNMASQRLNKGVGFYDYQRVTLKRISIGGFSTLKYYWVRDVHSKAKDLFLGRSEGPEMDLWHRFSLLRKWGARKKSNHPELPEHVGSHEYPIRTRPLSLDNPSPFLASHHHLGRPAGK